MRYARGETLAGIGRDFGISGEAVRQLLMRSGYVTPGVAERARRRQVELEREQRRSAIVSWLEQVPQTLTRRQAAEQIGMTAGELVGLIGKDTAQRLLIWAPGERRQVFSDEQLFEALRTVAAELGVHRLSRVAYDRARAEGMPSGVLIVQRLGAWNRACEQAGLEVGTRPKTYKNRRSDEELLGYVRTFLATSERFAARDYDEAAHRRKDWPSRTLLRQRFGSWNKAKAAAAEPARSRK